jgi:hypothetical protein
VISSQELLERVIKLMEQGIGLYPQLSPILQMLKEAALIESSEQRSAKLQNADLSLSSQDGHDPSTRLALLLYKAWTTLTFEAALEEVVVDVVDQFDAAAEEERASENEERRRIAEEN